MKTVFALCAAVVLVAACASAGGAPPSLPSARAPASGAVGAGPAAPGLQDPAQALRLAGQPGAPTTRQISDLLGPPDVDRRDGLGALLTWRLPGCALVLGFAQDRLSDVDAAAPAAGLPAPSLESCVAAAQARRP